MQLKIFCLVPGDTIYDARVREVLIVHVGCTRCVASNPDHTMHRQARITVGVGCTRACIVLFWCDVYIQGRVGSIPTFFCSIWLILFLWLIWPLPWLIRSDWPLPWCTGTNRRNLQCPTTHRRTARTTGCIWAKKMHQCWKWNWKVKKVNINIIARPPMRSNKLIGTNFLTFSVS